MELRKAYVSKLLELMKDNDKIVVLDADLAAAGGTKPIYDNFPERAFNVGIAESNMTGIAAGMSAYGYVPFIHSFAPFVSRRVFDQIAVALSYSKQNVKILGFDPGVTTTVNGGTHMCFEDVAMMRALPNITILDIVDGVQISKALPSIVDTYGNMYIRMARKQEKCLFDDSYQFVLGKADHIAEGSDITIVASGASIFEAVEATKALSEAGISVDLLSIHTIKPLDDEAILASVSKTNCVLTVENHSIHGGLYGAVCELLSRVKPTKCDGIAVYDCISQVGNLADLQKDYNLTPQDIVAKAKALVASK